MALLASEEEKKTTTTANNTATAEETSPTVKVDTPTTTTTTTTTKPATSAYNRTMEALQQAETSAPSFTSDYDSTIADLYGKIVNRQPFSYEASADPVYNQYKESYVQQGKQAMRDTQGQAAALTGGYGSSYGQAVGQQQYDAYLQRLNDVLPELYNAAYDRYSDEGNALTTNLALAEGMRDNEYNMFRDAVGDKQYNDAWALQQAETRAQYGDFGGLGELYGDDAETAARLSWASANPDAAWTAGLISADEYYMLTGAQPRQVLSATRSSGGGTRAASDILRDQLNTLKNEGRITQETYIASMNRANRF